MATPEAVDTLLSQVVFARQMRATAAIRKQYAMTGEQFAEALAKLDVHPRRFAEILVEHGHTATDPERSVRRWMSEKPSPEAVVIVRLLERLMKGSENKSADPQKGA